MSLAFPWTSKQSQDRNEIPCAVAYSRRRMVRLSLAFSIGGPFWLGCRSKNNQVGPSEPSDYSHSVDEGSKRLLVLLPSDHIRWFDGEPRSLSSALHTLQIPEIMDFRLSFSTLVNDTAARQAFDYSPFIETNNGLRYRLAGTTDTRHSHAACVNRRMETFSC